MSRYPVVTSPVFEDYWRFAAERQAIFFRRFVGDVSPWTDNPVLQRYRFTNTYRASDRVSQFLIQNVIYQDGYSISDIFFRIILFKLFNKIETWRILERSLERVTWSEFSFERYAKILSEERRNGNRIYSSAYIMPSGLCNFGFREKHMNHLRLLEMLMKADTPKRIAQARTMKAAYAEMLRFPTIGPFLAYQLVTDLNYSELTDFSEMEFVVPGPGARSGIRKCFQETRNLCDADIIRYVADHQAEEFENRGLKFQTLWGRPLQLIDCQNLFCEVDKLARVAHPEVPGLGGRTKIKRKHIPNPEPLEYWFPPKWGINEAVSASRKAIRAEIKHVC